MTDDPPKKVESPEVVIPATPSTTQSAIRIVTTISPERYEQLSGSKPPQICKAASIAEHDAQALLEADKTDRWLYLIAHGQLELELLLQIRCWEYRGRRRKYSVPGLKRTDGELAEFFGVKRPSVCRARKALMNRDLIYAVEGVLRIRYSTALERARAVGWRQ